MTSQSLLTYGAKVSTVEQVYYSPVVTLPPSNQILSSLYCVIAKVDAWPDDVNPPQPTQDQKSIKQFLKNVFVAKEITSNEITPVIQRIDWVSGSVYDYYRDDIDLFEVDENGILIHNFYVKNSFDQVFKCLWNAGGMPSIYEPYFEPGNYAPNNVYQNVDGYKWHYIFTVDSASKVNFMDTVWIPVPVGQNTPNPITSPTGEGYGGLDTINVIDGGSGYNPSNSVINVVITGDGYGANAVATVSNSSISEIYMTSPGTNYTFASATIVSANGSGAILAANTVSPIGGHGYDPVSELGCSHVMITSEFSGSENGYIPTDIQYHQVGILINPTTNNLSPLPANGAIYKTSTDLIVAGGFAAYSEDEIVYQGASYEAAYASAISGGGGFIGTVLNFDVATNQLKLINTIGSLTINAPVFGNSTGTARTLLSYTTPDFVPLSGYLVYIENRSAIQRSIDGIEQFKIVLGY